MSTVFADADTGDVFDPSSEVELVTLNLAAMDEDELISLFPTPVQATGALLKARDAARRAPMVLNEHRAALRAAERNLSLVVAKTVLRLKDDFPKSTITERKMLSELDEGVRDAMDHVDVAWLLLEYAKDQAKAVQQDIDILRSINANMRDEHRR